MSLLCGAVGPGDIVHTLSTTNNINASKIIGPFSEAQLPEVSISYLIKINSAQLMLDDIQYFLHWVSFNIHQQHLLLQYPQYSTIARSLSFASRGEDSCWSICLSCPSCPHCMSASLHYNFGFE